MAKFYLKDWHGKEKEFTDEKIFVRGEDGELIQFTQGEGDKPAVVQPLEVTENGTYTAPDGVDGYSPVTVNVKGGGGGLEPGVYFQTLGIRFYGSYYRAYYQLNGVLYVFLSHDTTYKNLRYIKKWSGSSWESVYDYGDKNHTLSTNALCLLEFNGKLHLYNGSSGGGKAHWVFDGTTLTQCADLPYGTLDGELFVENGLLKYCARNNNVYAWDEASDTWTVERTVTRPSTSSYNGMTFFAVGTAIYAIDIQNKKLYSYSAGTFTLIGNMTATPYSNGHSYLVVGNTLYFISSAYENYTLPMYAMDVTTGATEMLGYTSCNGMVKYDGKTCAYGEYHKNGTHLASVHIVTE